MIARTISNIGHSSSGAHGSAAANGHQGKSKHEVAQHVMAAISPELHEANVLHGFADHALEKGREMVAHPKEAAEHTKKRAEKLKEGLELPKKPHEYFDKLHKSVEHLRGFRHSMRDIERAGEAARQHVKSVAQMAHDVARLKRHEQLLIHMANASGSKFARDRLSVLQPHLKRLQLEYHSEKRFVRDYMAIWKSHIPQSIPTFRGGAKNVEHALVDAEHALGGVGKNVEHALAGIEKRVVQSPVGKRLLNTGKLFFNEKVFIGLDALAGVAEAIEAHETSTAETKYGKAVNAAGAGLLAFGATRSGLTSADPLLEKAFGKHNTVGSFYRGVSDTVGAYSDACFKHDSQALSAVHSKAMKGEYSSVLKGYALVGEAIANSSWVDNKIAWAADTVRGVPKDVRTSLVWWGSH